MIFLKKYIQKILIFNRVITVKKPKVLLLGYEDFTKYIEKYLIRNLLEVDFLKSNKIFNIAKIEQYDLVIINWAEIVFKDSLNIESDLHKTEEVLSIINKKNIPIFWIVHNIFPHELATQDKIFYEKLNNVFIEYSTYIFALNEYEVNVLKKIGAPKEKIKKLFHPHYHTEFKDLKLNKKIAKIKIKRKKTDFIYLTFGYIRPYKKIPDLVRNFKKIKTESDYLYIIGNAFKKKYVEEIKNLIEDDHIILIDKYTSDSMLAKYISASDVIVFNYEESLNSNSGAVCLAQSFSKPIICPRHSMFNELVNNKFAISYSSEDELIATLKKIKDQDLSKMGDSAFAKIQGKDFNFFSKEIVRYYKEIKK